MKATKFFYKGKSGIWTVYIGSHSGIFTSVCLDTGLENWKIRLPGRIEASASVSNCGDFVFVGNGQPKISFF